MDKKKLLPLSLLAALTAADGGAAGPAGIDGFCAKTTVDGKAVPITDAALGGKLDGVAAKLKAAPDQAWLESGRKDPFYRVNTVPMVETTFPDGHVERRPDLNAAPKDAGFVCDDSSAALGTFLGCLEGMSSGYRNASQSGNLRGKFINALGGMNSYLLKSPSTAGSAVEGEKFLSGLMPVQANDRTANSIRAKAENLAALKNKCTVPGCGEAVDRAVQAFKIYAGTEFTSAVAGFTQKKFKEHHGIPSDVYFESCAAPTPRKVAAPGVERRKAPVDPVAALFRDESGTDCNLAIPRVLCHSGDAFDATRAKGSDGKGDGTQPMLPSQLPPLTPAVTEIVKGDVKEFMINTYLSGWKAEAERSLNGAELVEANRRLNAALSCKSGGSDPNLFTPKVDEAAQKEKKLQGALAAACVNQLSTKFAALQVKHGLGLKVLTGPKIVVQEYLAAAKKNMTPEGRKNLERALTGLELSEGAMYLVPGVAQVYPFIKVSVGQFYNAQLLNLSATFDEKNKCAGMYAPDSPLFHECSASFALMNEVGAESSTLLRAHPALSDNGGKEDGAPGYSRASVKLPGDVSRLVADYVPGRGGSCVQQAREAIKGRESEVSFDEGVFASGPAQKRLQTIESQLAKFCSDSDANHEVEDLLLSPELTARYFNCETQPPYVRDAKQAFGCEERAKFAWALCRENMKITAARGKGKDLAAAIGGGLPALMDSIAAFTPAAGFGRAALGTIVTQGAIGAGIGGGLMYLADGAGEKGSTPQANLERERAKLAAGFGSSKSVDEAKLAAEEFQKANGEWLGSRPALKAAVEGFVTGALLGAVTGSHGATGKTAKMKAAYRAAAAAEQDAKLVAAYRQLKEGGAFAQGEKGKQLEQAMLAEIRARAETASGKKVKAKDLASKPAEDQVRVLEERTPAEAKRKVAQESERERVKVAEERAKRGEESPVSEPEMTQEEAATVLKEKGLELPENPADPVNQVINQDQQSAAKIVRTLKDRFGNNLKVVGCVLKAVSVACPKDKAALQAVLKNCGVKGPFGIK